MFVCSTAISDVFRFFGFVCLLSDDDDADDVVVGVDVENKVDDDDGDEKMFGDVVGGDVERVLFVCLFFVFSFKSLCNSNFGIIVITLSSFVCVEISIPITNKTRRASIK